MRSFNKITICGYVSRDLEVKQTAKGQSSVSFYIATTNWRKDDKAEETSTWFRCTLYGKTAETASQILRKGSPVMIMGKVELQEWVDKEQNTRTMLNVFVEEWQALEKRQAATAKSSAGQSQGDAFTDAVDGNDDIPWGD